MMAMQHPHTDAQYTIVHRPDASYGIRIEIPAQEPAIVTGFASRSEAEAWIAKHRQRVLAKRSDGPVFKRARDHDRPANQPRSKPT
jgi:hypothetical protein